MYIIQDQKFMLTSKEKSELKHIANSKGVNKYILGKGIIDENVILSLENGLNKNELIKITILKTCPYSINELELMLIDKLKCEVVQQIGRNILIYKKSKRTDIKHIL